MNHNVPNQNGTASSSAGKKLFLPLAVSVLAAAVAGGVLMHHLSEPPLTEIETIPSETTAESKILETDLSAAASVQKESSDVISESVKESVPETVTVTEVTTEQETAAPESVSEELPSTEPETDILTETIPVQEPETSITEEITTETETVPAVTVPEHTAPAVSDSVPETTAESVTETTVPDEKVSYRSILEHIFKYHSFQDDVFELVNESDIFENEFAVYDVDCDGTDELVIRWSNTSAAAVSGVVYGYDEEGNICRKLKTTPYLRFYSNGIIEADAAHKSGLAGDFWAYSLYQYDNTSGIYTESGYVDAWDKSIADENWYTQETFPDYADVSNSGFVYFICPPGSDDVSAFSDPMDVTEYQAWHDSYIGGASELNIPFRKMTETNIEQVD